MKYNNDFKYDLETGQIGEKLLGSILSEQKIEVKKDNWITKSGNIAIEFESRGKPSGIVTSEATWWCFIISGAMQDKMIVMIETSKLKEIFTKEYKNGNIKKMGDSNTSKAVLVKFKDLINYTE